MTQKEQHETSGASNSVLADQVVSMSGIAEVLRGVSERHMRRSSGGPIGRRAPPALAHAESTPGRRPGQHHDPETKIDLLWCSITATHSLRWITQPSSASDTAVDLMEPVEGIDLARDGRTKLRQPILGDKRRRGQPRDRRRSRPDTVSSANAWGQEGMLAADTDSGSHQVGALGERWTPVRPAVLAVDDATAHCAVGPALFSQVHLRTPAATSFSWNSLIRSMRDYRWPLYPATEHGGSSSIAGVLLARSRPGHTQFNVPVAMTRQLGIRQISRAGHRRRRAGSSGRRGPLPGPCLVPGS